MISFWNEFVVYSAYIGFIVLSVISSYVFYSAVAVCPFVRI